MYALLFLLFSLGNLYVCFCQSDPCDSANHKIFPQENFGSRNEKCEPDVSSPCDFYFVAGWYVVVNATFLNQCPSLGYCGTTYPAWLNGTFPEASDGIVNRTACIKHGPDCCGRNVTIQIKKCKDFHLYYFVQLPTCPMAYCFVSDLPCEPPTTTTESSTATATVKTTKATADGQSGVNSKSIIIGVSVGMVCLIIAITIVAVGCMYNKGMLYKQRQFLDSSSTSSRIVIIPSKGPLTG